MDVKEREERVIDHCLVLAVVVVEVERPEENVVEVMTDLVGGAVIEGVDVGCQAGCRGQDAGACGQSDVNVTNAHADAVAALMNFVHLSSDDGAVERGVHGGVDEVAFPFVELLQFAVQGAAHLACGGVVVGNRVVEDGREAVGEGLRQGEFTVDVADRLFDELDWEVWQVAVADLLAATEVVGVAFAAAASGFDIDQAGFTVPFGVAAVTAKLASKVVLQDDDSFAARVAASAMMSSFVGCKVTPRAPLTRQSHRCASAAARSATGILLIRSSV